MGFFKEFFGVLDVLRGYEITCKYCGKNGFGLNLQEALRDLQGKSDGCGRNCHEPIITRQPK